MNLTVLASGSSGNGYVLEGRGSALIIECGVSPEKMMQNTWVPMSYIAGCLVSHEHGDHAAYAERYADMGMQVYASAGTLEACGLQGGKAVPLKAMQTVMVGDFIVRPFDVRHDAAEPLGFIIEHPECGRLLFVTDTRMVPYNFKSLCLRHIMAEANYSDRILEERVGAGDLAPAQAARVRATHMSLDAACELVKANETQELESVTLIHLSDRNADRREFADAVHKCVLFAKVRVAHAGLSFDLSKNDFKI